MIKSLKISGDNVPVSYLKLAEDDAGEYDADTGKIRLNKALGCHEHDETIAHEIVHALQFKSSLRHLRLSDDAWEIIAGEVGKAIADNFILLPR